MARETYVVVLYERPIVVCPRVGQPLKAVSTTSHVRLEFEGRYCAKWTDHTDGLFPSHMIDSEALNREKSLAEKAPLRSL